MSNKPVAAVDVLRFRDCKWLSEKDEVAAEAEITVVLNGHELVKLTATPRHLSELAAGYLYCSGMIDSIKRVESLKVDETQGRVYVVASKSDSFNECPCSYLNEHPGDCLAGSSSGCSTDCPETTALWDVDPLDPNDLIRLMNEFEKSCHLFHETGGSHAVAISDGKGIILLREDIGRCNAIDKVVGYCLLNHVNASDKILFISARASSEIIGKACRLRTPILVSPSAPTDKAVKLAHERELTLVGFARSNRFNVYSGFSRIRHY
ncbi:MAG: formate dehydrogenase accessory sulfurtransferase FdhD [Bacillota bacterium]